MTAVPLLFARQPILDKHQRVFAYEVLYRSLDLGTSACSSPDVATATVSVHAVLDVGLDALAGGAQVFFNVTREFVAQGLYAFLPAERVVLDVCANAENEIELVKALARAKADGYRIALDGSVLARSSPALAALADVIKVEVRELDEAGLRRHAHERARPGVLLLAQKVETRPVQRCCADAGYDLFQGYYFARPELVAGSHAPPDRALLMRLLVEVQNPSATLESIERLVVGNTALSYKLLRYVNSAMRGVVHPIQSIRHAIMMLGLERLRIAASMLLLAGLDSKPDELVVTALLRARLCQLIGARRGREDPHKLFTLGLLSLLDSFLDRPMEEVLEHLPLAPELRGALLHNGGPLRQTLETAIAFERRDEERIAASGFEAREWNACYADALKWTSELTQLLRR